MFVCFDYFYSITRFLKARSWDLQSAGKMMRKDVQWRQEFRPDLTDCKNCHNQPGTHSLVSFIVHFFLRVYQANKFTYF